MRCVDTLRNATTMVASQYQYCSCRGERQPAVGVRGWRRVDTERRAGGQAMASWFMDMDNGNGGGGRRQHTP